MEQKVICTECGESIDLTDAIEINGEYYCKDCVVQCENCGEWFLKDDCTYVSYEDGYVCEDCLGEDYVQCRDCGQYFPQSKCTYVDYCDDWVCEDCLSENYETCYECGEYYPYDEMYKTQDGHSVCESCCENYYAYCDDCGDLVHLDSAYYDDFGTYCESCWNEKHSSIVKNYHAFNDWSTYFESNPNESITKGFELEVECDENCADDLSNLLKDFAVYEHDSSVHGFEIITNPFTRQYQASHKDMFKKMFEVLKSYDFGTECGLHVHVDKKALATNELTSDNVIDNILIIMESFKKELIIFSRRSKGAIKDWCRFLTDEDEKITMSKINEKKDDSRYHALNITNKNTIEFRLFKTPETFEQLMSALELVDNIVDIAKQGNIDGLSWLDIVNYGGDYIHAYNDQKDIKSSVSLSLVGIEDEKYNDFEIGDIVSYGSYKAIVIENDNPDSILIAIDDGECRHSGYDNKYKNTEFGEHCWYCGRSELRHLVEPLHGEQLRIGARVLVRNDLVYGREYGNDVYVRGMEQFLGKVVEIESLVSTIYRKYKIHGSQYNFTNEMFVGKIKNININNYLHGNN